MLSQTNEDSKYILAKIDWRKLAQEYVQTAQSIRLKEKKSFYSTPPTGYPQQPPSLQLRNYQRAAVVNWFNNRGRGTLKMATGSGKTIVALAIATELYHKIDLQVLLIVCPFAHLVTQWQREAQKFNLQPILAYDSVYSWQSLLSTQLYNIHAGTQKFLSLITTNSTLISAGMQSQLKYFPAKTLIVGDEVHNLGSTTAAASLPRQIGLRLGLSATPERHYDREGTDAVFQYFGSIIPPEFGLAEAIAAGALVPYEYYPILVELTALETIKYARLTRQIGWAIQQNDDLEHNTALKTLLIRRSRLIANASHKLDALRQLMSQRLHTSHTLFYCGDGYVDKGNQKQLEAVTRILGRELGYRVNTYTADTPIEVREQLRHQLETGQLQGLVAVRCLDEGVDIPAIQTAVILASTGNPRQFIQRRGRILRPHPHKQQATLFDLIVTPPELDRQVWQVERNLLGKELKRYCEFATLALNASQALGQLKMILAQYQLEIDLDQSLF